MSDNMFIYYLHKKNKYQKSRNSLCVCLFCGNSDLYQLFSKRSYVRFHEYEETNHLIRGVTVVKDATHECEETHWGKHPCQGIYVGAVLARRQSIAHLRL